MDVKNRILKNTFFLYFRSITTLLLALLTSRVVLEALGAEDFGVYQVVGGLVAAISFLNSTMSSATQRYLAFEIGIGNRKKIKKTFATAVNVHFMFSAIVFVIIMIAGEYFLQNHLELGNVDISVARWVLLFSSLSVVLTINSVPYNAFLIAQENMSYFAYIDILGAILKLCVGYAILWFSDHRLVLYALLMFFISLILRLLYIIVTKSKYEDAKYYFVWDTKLMKNMLGFSGWVSLAAFAYMIKTQGLSVILNIFFGPLINAAIGIGNQLNSAVRTFSQNFQMSFAPQIVKTYATKEYENMNKLILSGAKLSTYLLIFFSMPIIIETEYILGIWLKEVPSYTPVIVRIILIETLFETFTSTGNKAIRATGNVKKFEISYNLFQLLSLPTIIIYLSYGHLYYVPSLIIAIFIFLSTFIKIHFLKKQIPGFNRKEYINQILVRSICIILFSSIGSFSLCYIMNTSLLRFLLNIVLSESCFFFSVFFLGMTIEEKLMLKNVINKVLRR